MFQRDGNDLHMTYKIGLVEALCGFQCTFKHLDGRQIVVKYPPGKVIEPGKSWFLSDLRFSVIFYSGWLSKNIYYWALSWVKFLISSPLFTQIIGCVRVVRGEGMPQYRNPFEKGDLYMKFDVQFPENNWINPDKLSVSIRQQMT